LPTLSITLKAPVNMANPNTGPSFMRCFRLTTPPVFFLVSMVAPVYIPTSKFVNHNAIPLPDKSTKTGDITLI
jgi:hypothetical protein